MKGGANIQIKRQHILYRFAKDLVRRSRSKCELCGDQGQRLHIYELLHEEAYTDASHCLFICNECFGQITDPTTMDSRHWHCLYHAIWSEIPVVQVMAIHLLDRLAETDYWAAELREQCLPTEEIAQWVDLTNRFNR
jgi:protein PhnA